MSEAEALARRLAEQLVREWEEFGDELAPAVAAFGLRMRYEGYLSGAEEQRDAAYQRGLADGRAWVMSCGEDDKPGITEAKLEEIIAEACAPGLPAGKRAGKLLAAWRSWWGTGGPGLFSRLGAADDVRRVIEAAEAEAYQRGRSGEA